MPADEQNLGLPSLQKWASVGGPDTGAHALIDNPAGKRAEIGSGGRRVCLIEDSERRQLRHLSQRPSSSVSMASHPASSQPSPAAVKGGGTALRLEASQGPKPEPRGFTKRLKVGRGFCAGAPMVGFLQLCLLHSIAYACSG